MTRKRRTPEQQLADLQRRVDEHLHNALLRQMLHDLADHIKRKDWAGGVSIASAIADECAGAGGGER